MSLIWTVLGIALMVMLVLYFLRDRIRGKAVPALLLPGQPLPSFSLVDEQSNPVNSEDLSGRPAVLLFVRGSWCPFCSKQVANLTKHYKEITDSGARLILITPKPLETTRRVANFFEVDFEFWLDNDLAVTRMLGLVQSAGVPNDYQSEYGEDTIWPTSLVVDSDGIIRLTEMSRFIADRPNPEKLLNAVNRL